MVEGDTKDWDRLVEEHASRVFRVALRILGSVQDAEDISQDVFAEAFRSHAAKQIRSWEAFFVRLATLRALDRSRRRRSTAELRDGDLVSNAQPFDELAAEELADWLRHAIAQLPDQQAAVFVMFHFEHLSREAVSAALGISPEAVSTALHKARQTLSRHLAVFNRGDSK